VNVDLDELEKTRVQLATVHFIKGLTILFTRENDQVPVADIVDSVLVAVDKFVEGCKNVETMQDIENKFIM